MGALTLRLPNSLHKKVKELAKKEGVSVNQFITVALAEKISSLMTLNYLEEKARSASKKGSRKLWPKFLTGNH